jgi:ABC-type branched-subunit amino acid transport system substrate-binding protein
MGWNCFAAAAFLAAAPLAAAQGVTATEILIGQTSSFSGAIGGEVREQTEGAKLYIDWVNAGGGVHGRKIRLLSVDDAFDPKRAAQNARDLVSRGVFALFLTRGTPQNEAILPVLKESARRSSRLPPVPSCCTSRLGCSPTTARRATPTRPRPG